MTRWWRMIAGLILGVMLGAVSVLTIQDAVTSPKAAGPPATAAPAVGSTAPEAPLPSKTPRIAPDALLLAWTSDPLAAATDVAVRASPVVSHATAVRRNEIDLTGVRDASGSHLDEHEGFVVPVDTMAFDPATYLDFVSPAWATLLGSLRDDQIVLSRAGARIRGVGVGAGLTLAGRVFRVAGEVDDDVLGGAEVGLNRHAGEGVGLQFDRYLLVTYRTDRDTAESAVKEAIGDVPIRFRGPGETPFLRNADAVLPLAAIKETFGEFGIRRGPPLEQAADWQDANLVPTEVPVLGPVRCHRAILPALRGAMAQLEREQLGYLVDPATSVACWRLGTIQTERRLSREAWGVGIELNGVKNRTGDGSVQDQRLISVLEQWGFGWGGRWLTPEPLYFEYLGPPRG